MNLMQFFRDGRHPTPVRARRVPRINWPVLGLAFYWYYWQNKYFGWNRTPHSELELISDGLFFLLLALSVRSSGYSDR